MSTEMSQPFSTHIAEVQKVLLEAGITVQQPEVEVFQPPDPAQLGDVENMIDYALKTGTITSEQVPVYGSYAQELATYTPRIIAERSRLQEQILAGKAFTFGLSSGNAGNENGKLGRAFLLQVVPPETFMKMAFIVPRAGESHPSVYEFVGMKLPSQTKTGEIPKQVQIAYTGLFAPGLQDPHIPRFSLTPELNPGHASFDQMMAFAHLTMVDDTQIGVLQGHNGYNPYRPLDMPSHTDRIGAEITWAEHPSIDQLARVAHKGHASTHALTMPMSVSRTSIGEGIPTTEISIITFDFDSHVPVSHMVWDPVSKTTREVPHVAGLGYAAAFDPRFVEIDRDPETGRKKGSFSFLTPEKVGLGRKGLLRAFQNAAMTDREQDLYLESASKLQTQGLPEEIHH